MQNSIRPVQIYLMPDGSAPPVFDVQIADDDNRYSYDGWLPLALEKSGGSFKVTAIGDNWLTAPDDGGDRPLDAGPVEINATVEDCAAELAARLLAGVRYYCGEWENRQLQRCEPPALGRSRDRGDAQAAADTARRGPGRDRGTDDQRTRPSRHRHRNAAVHGAEQAAARRTVRGAGDVHPRRRGVREDEPPPRWSSTSSRRRPRPANRSTA